MVHRRNKERNLLYKQQHTLYPPERERTLATNVHSTSDYGFYPCLVPDRRYGYATSTAPLRYHSVRFFLVVACSTQTSSMRFFLNQRTNVGSHSSEAMPRSLQQRISALDLQPSTAEGSWSALKYVFSPWACEANLPKKKIELATTPFKNIQD